MKPALPGEARHGLQTGYTALQGGMDCAITPRCIRAYDSRFDASRLPQLWLTGNRVTEQADASGTGYSTP